MYVWQHGLGLPDMVDKQHFFLNQGDVYTRMGQPHLAKELYKQAVREKVEPHLEYVVPLV